METDLTIADEGVEGLADYARIPISFRVASRFRVEGVASGELALREEPVDPPWIKNYDDDEGERPRRWARRWDLSNWAVFLARRDGIPVAGAVVACRTEGADLLEGRDDLAVLWDIRVHPDHRGTGLGRALFERGESWARQQGCTQWKVETQDINVPACRFYLRMGCRLDRAHPGAYADLPDETQLFLTKDLRP
jgi:GNAT superfamily N-acetyltransferase